MSGPETVDETQHRRSEPGFVSDPAVRWTILRQVGAFLLLFACTAMALFLFPQLFSAEQLPSEAQEYVGFASTVGLTRLGVGVFAVFLWFAGGPLLGAVLGVAAGARGGTSRGYLAVASGIGAYLGFVIPIVLGSLVASAMAPIQGALGTGLVTALKLGIPTALAAAGMTFLSAG